MGSCCGKVQHRDVSDENLRVWGFVLYLWGVGSGWVCCFVMTCWALLSLSVVPFFVWFSTYPRVTVFNLVCLDFFLEIGVRSAFSFCHLFVSLCLSTQPYRFLLVIAQGGYFSAEERFTLINVLICAASNLYNGRTLGAFELRTCRERGFAIVLRWSNFPDSATPHFRNWLDSAISLLLNSWILHSPVYMINTWLWIFLFARDSDVSRVNLYWERKGWVSEIHPVLCGTFQHLTMFWASHVSGNLFFQVFFTCLLLRGTRLSLRNSSCVGWDVSAFDHSSSIPSLKAFMLVCCF